MEKELAKFDENQTHTTTLHIAGRCKIEHRAVIKLLRTYQKNEILSSFEMSKISRGGRPIEYAILSWKQASFLITLMKNSKETISFKETLINNYGKNNWILF